MTRNLLLACLTATLPLVVLSVLPSPAQAQISARAYAPENLRQLSQSDRARVIEREYADQSRGRRIPDDQMEFYLDQINSGWSFSQIKQDIATSLRGNGGWNGGGGNNGGSIRCESNDNRERVCNTGWRGATLVRQLSKTQCIEGQNWGSRNGAVWVTNGCRAEFSEGRGGGNWGGGGGNGNGGVVRCESNDNRQRVCPTGWRSSALVRQLSKSQCVEGRSWGSSNGHVWVSDGCRAEFSEGRGGNWGGGGNWNGGNNNYSVTCNSDNNRQNSCAWDRRQGRPVLIEQISNTRCVEGRNWGADGSSIWVNGGCRARFGAR